MEVGPSLVATRAMRKQMPFTLKSPKYIWAMVNTHYMVDGHPIHNKDPHNGYYKSLWTIGWLAPINGY